jgi:CRP/FNR family transcriptional regulator
MQIANASQTGDRNTGFNYSPITAAPARDPLDRFGAIKAYAAGQEIFGEMEPADAYFKVLSGAVRIYSILDDGRRQIVDFILPGQIFGYTFADEHSNSAEAICDVSVVRYERHEIDRNMDGHPELSRRILAITSMGFDLAQKRVVTLGCKNAVERLASFLLMMAEYSAEDVPHALPMSRHDIADYLGLTTETVSRLFTKFRRDELIRLTDTRSFEIIDHNALEYLTGR